MSRGWPGARALVMALLACGAAAADHAAARAEGRTSVIPRSARPADARIWTRLEEAARKQPAGARRAVAVAEVGFYPRTPAESEAFLGNALLLVTTLAGRIEDAPVEAVTLHYVDGETDELVHVTAQTNDVDPARFAARLIGPYRHDALFYVPVSATTTRAYVTASFAGREEVVLRFPRAAPASPNTPPAANPGVETMRGTEILRIGGMIYPFFRVPPFRSPATQRSCAHHEPEPGSPAKGALDKEDIRRTVRAHLAEVRACYELELVTAPKLSTRVMVTFTIGADGWVVAAVPEKADVDRPKLSACIAEVARCWRFPRPIRDGVVIVSYPFVLSPAADSE